MKIKRSERKRVFSVFALFCLWFLLIFATLIKTQVLEYNKYLSKIKAQSHRIITLHPKRGTIFDRQGEVLAISIKTKSAFLSSKDIKKSQELFEHLRKVVSLSKKKQLEIRRRMSKGERFIWVKRKLADSEYRRLERLASESPHGALMGFIDEYKRIYPQRKRASHVLGGVGIDEQGLYGIEYALDEVLRGRGGKVKVVLDARRRIFKFQYIDTPVAGRDVYLTIDSAVQFFVEKELHKTVQKYNARGGAVIVMRPEDGRILAMASYPDYSPDRLRYTPTRLLKNYAVSFLYDPGSTFKIVLASSALENKVCYPQQVFKCFNGEYQLEKRTITDVHPYEKLSFEDIIIKSSNIGAARIGLRLGKERYFRTIKDFGFGSQTGMRLPAEEKGILNPLERWGVSSVASASFGYEISVTPMQMARAFNVIASGGYLVSPRILESVVGMRVRQRPRERILSEATYHRLLPILTEVVRRGTGRKTHIEGIDIAGKTGTAHKNVRGKYQKIYISSFGGFFPAQNPRVTVYVLVDEPKGLFYGGDVAAPLFRDVARKLMIYLRVFPEVDGTNEIRI